MADAKKVRADLKKRIQAVNNKIKRIQNTTGAKVSGSEFDPRRKKGIENKYNVKQMQSYLAELNDFMRRGNQFISGRRGAPLPRGEVSLMQQRQARAEQARKAHDAAIGNLMTPMGMPYREASEAVSVTAGSARYGPYIVYNFRPQDITNAESLRKLSNKILKQTLTSYLKENLESGRESAIKALMFMGERKMAEDIASLSDYQFDAFWNGTNSAELIFFKYAEEKISDEASSKERWQSRVANEQFADVVGYIDWASSEVPREAPTQTKSNPKTRR